MSWLIDTNVISELRKRDRCHPRVAAWFVGVDAEDVYLSVLVIGEIRRGIAAIRRRDPRGAAALEVWLSRVVLDHSQRILPVDQPVAEAWGPLNAPDPLPTVDGLLAATAKVHRLTLVTRNLRHAQRTGVACLDPFLA